MYGDHLVYTEKTKDKIKIHRFTIRPKNGTHVIHLESEVETKRISQTYTVDSYFATLFWEYKDEGLKTHISAIKKGDTVWLSGHHKGKPIKKKFATRNLMWNQVFNIGLEKFLLSNQQTIKFRAIGTSGPGEMKMATFSVKKKGVETLTFKDQAVECVRLRISLSGLLSIFWHGGYWYRKSDGRFVQYKGKSGPGKSVTIMKLVGED
jgi:hypothetical protein